MLSRRPAAYVVVSGAPGSGKSTVARDLADLLDLPLFSKDTIKESLVDALGADSIAESQRLGAAAIRALLAVAAENGCGVLDSTWQASLVVADLRTLPAPVVEVFCALDPEIARARYRERASVRHPGHFDEIHGSTTELWSGERIQPVAGGWPILRIDTSSPVASDVLHSLVRDAITST